MADLAICQTNFMQVLLQKIDRRHKPIRKQERLVTQNLKKKRIFLEAENFDIIKILKKAVRCGSASQEDLEDDRMDAPKPAASVQTHTY